MYKADNYKEDILKILKQSEDTPIQLLTKLKSFNYGYKNDHCALCKGNTEGYMVTKRLWKHHCKKQNISTDSLICLRCLNKSMNRKFKEKDFIDAPINYGIFHFDVRWFIDLQKEYFKL